MHFSRLQYRGGLALMTPLTATSKNAISKMKIYPGKGIVLIVQTKRVVRTKKAFCMLWKVCNIKSEMQIIHVSKNLIFSNTLAYIYARVGLLSFAVV